MARLSPFTPALVVLAVILPLAAWMMTWVRGLEHEVVSLQRDREDLERLAGRRAGSVGPSSAHLAEELAAITRMARAAVGGPLPTEAGGGGQETHAGPDQPDAPTPSAGGGIATGPAVSAEPGVADGTGQAGPMQPAAPPPKPTATAAASDDPPAPALFGPRTPKSAGSSGEEPDDPGLEQYRRHLATVHGGYRQRFGRVLALSVEQDLGLLDILDQRRDLLLDLYRDKELPPTEVSIRSGQIESHFLDATQRLLSLEQLPQFYQMYPERRPATAVTSR